MIKTYNLISAQKDVLTLSSVLNNKDGHRLILPPGDAQIDIPYKIIDFWHREKLCLGSFLLATQVSLKYFVFSVKEKFAKTKIQTRFQALFLLCD